MPFGLQPTHILIIVVIAMLLFGASRLPEIGRGLGRSINEFKKGVKDMPAEFSEGMNEGPAGNPSAPAAPVIMSTASTGAAGNFCPTCGASNIPEAKFCNKCGSALPVA